jgi:hypothetical protein
MEIQLRAISFRLLLLGTCLLMFSTTSVNAQRIENIKTSSDGQQVRVTYDLVGLTSRQMAKVSLSFESDRRGIIEPTQVTGKTLLFESGRSNTLVWEADKEMPGLNAYLVPRIQMDLEKYSYFELGQRRGDLVNKSFTTGMTANILFPGLGWKYASGGTKGKGRMLAFGAILASGLIAHQMARSSYQSYKSTLDEGAYMKANSLHHISMGMGASAAIFYINSQLSFAGKRVYFSQSPRLYE